MTLASCGTITRPDPNGQMPAMARNSVDLPAPDGPVTSTRSPGENTMCSALTSGSPLGRRTRKLIERNRVRRLARQHLDRRRRQRDVAAGDDRVLESGQPRDHRAVLRDRLVGRDEIGQRGLHAVERGGGLHQAAELHGAGEIGRAHHQIGKDHRGLRIALREEGQLLLPLHDGDPVRHHEAEAAEVALALGGFAVQRRDLLGILARAHQIEAESRPRSAAAGN